MASSRFMMPFYTRGRHCAISRADADAPNHNSGLERHPHSAPLRGPITPACGSARPASPSAAARRVRQPATPNSVSLLDGDGSLDEARRRDPAPESRQVRMEDDAVADLDAEIIGGIASSILRDEQKIPCAIERRCREC